MPNEQEGQEELESTEEETETSNEEVNQESSEEEQSNESSQDEEKLYDIEGEQMTLQQIKDGFMRQDDYTRKTQELADQRREYEQHGSNALPDQKDEYEGYDESQKEVLQMIDKRIDEQIQKAIKPVEDNLTDSQVKQEIADVQKKFKLDEDQIQEVLREADKLNANQLEPVVKAMLYEQDKERAKQEGEEKAKQNIQKRKAAITESPAGSGEVPKGKYDVKGKSYDDILDDAKRELSNMDN